MIKTLLVKLYRFIKGLYLNHIYRIKINIGTFLRRHNTCKTNKFSPLKKYKNIHKGERCFIIATGPSLTKEDILKLKNEITFSMNSICLLFDEIDWKPTYYGIQDIYVYEKLKSIIYNSNMKNIFISDFICRKHKPKKEWIQFPLNLLDHAYGYKKIRTKFSDDPYHVVYDGFTITYSIMQIAAFMGFNKIYLLGADTNYEDGKAHHIKEHGSLDSTFRTAGERMIYAYKIAKNYFDNKKIEVYNATRGGKLELFPRVELDRIVSNEYEKEKS